MAADGPIDSGLGSGPAAPLRTAPCGRATVDAARGAMEVKKENKGRGKEEATQLHLLQMHNAGGR